MTATPEVVILIVDDRKQNLFALEQTLRKVPAKVVQATSGDEALALTLQHDFALAILDVQMPGMDGYELAEMLLGDPATARIPIIFVTAAYSDEQHRFLGYRAGAVDYIVKPFDPEILLGKVQVFLELARYRLGLETLVQQRTRALSASEANYRTILENAFDIIQYSRPDGTLEFVSASWERVLGYTSEDRRTLTAGALVAPEARDAATQRFQEVLSGRAVGTFETTLVARDGRKVQVEGNAVPFLDEGRVSSIRAFFRDITERREAETRLELALVGAEVGLWDWRFPAGSAVLTGVWPDIEGLAPAASMIVDEESWFRLVHPEDLPRVQAEFGRHFARETDIYECEFRVRLRGGGWAWLLDRGRVLERDSRDRPLRMAGTSIDITDRKRSEEERTRLQRAEAVSRARNDFLSGMSHEIRTPMNAILGYAQLLRRESGLTARQREYLDTINVAGDHLLGLVNQVLDMARIEGGHLPIVESSVHFPDLLLELERMFRMTAEDRGLWLTVRAAKDVPEWIRTDAGKVRQVLINLLSNALKFTDRGGVAVRASVEGGGDDEVRLLVEVEDSGCGIEDDQRDRIFEAFGQTEAGRRKPGTGLGLAVSRDFARRMGGDVTVDSVPGSRSLFRFRFAARISEDCDAPAVASRVVGLGPRHRHCRVLVVDPRADSRAALVHLLESVGFEVRIAGTGQEALVAFEAEQPNLVVAKADLPDRSGSEFLLDLREARGGAGIPVVMVGSIPSDRERAGVLEAGADAFVCAPVSEEDLFGEIGRVAGVEYVRFGESGVIGQGPDSALDAAAIQGMPRDLREGLRRAVESGYPDAIDRQIERVERLDPGLAQGLRALARDFDYEALLGLLGPAQES